MSMNSTNPTNLFGGTWEAINSRFLIGVGTATGEVGEKYDFKLGGTGGEYSHKLVINEIPSHNHSIHVAGTRLDVNNDNVFRAQVYTPTSGGNFWNIGLARTGLGSHDAGITNTGGNGGHNNLPPFLVVHMWKRTA